MLRFASVAVILLASSLASADSKVDAKRLADLEHTPLRAGSAAKDTAPATLDHAKVLDAATPRYKAVRTGDDDLEVMRYRVLEPKSWLARDKR
jgi:hypothetical protein